MPDEASIEIPPGIIAITTYGAVTGETVKSLLDMQAHAVGKGLRNIRWDIVKGHLVDKARNEAAQGLLQSKAAWIWFLDADMVWKPELIEHMLLTAFGSHKHADILGGWCCLKGTPYLPTMDTGTGTWEPHDANQGVIEVIRTGGACVLIKRHVLERMTYPWFGVRPAPRVLDMFSEVDGFARQKFDGRNPLQKLDEWRVLVNLASSDAQQSALRVGPQRPPWFGLSTVGEDSAFCDAAKAAGFRILVNTNAICHHLEMRAVGPREHHDAMRDMQKLQLQCAGILE